MIGSLCHLILMRDNNQSRCLHKKSTNKSDKQFEGVRTVFPILLDFENALSCYWCAMGVWRSIYKITHIK